MTGARPTAGRPARRSLWRRGATGAALLLAGVGLAGCWMYPAEWNEKLTVTIATPQGDVSGSAVRWQTLSEDPVLRSAHARLGGEAVVVEVAKGRYLFALLQQYRPQTEILFFPDEAPLESAYKLNSRKGEVLTVPREMYPMLVTFGNLSSPASVQQVDPANLAATFGPGYALKSITLEITDEPVTKGWANKLLPWLGPYPEPGLCKSTNELEYPLCRQVTHGSFRRS
ncbi:MAG: hypothetical protein IOC82_00600 [Aestuariivirga sp.]|uniref:hypothetical protein n=1 Tax=Aestuariivirga sp. TaxID=2650926 RepID=UPI0025B880B6|nr:hypothetical protein [Aestuariivirga sp.]MCA3559513.1 hypothetical protein [Aestuariivirga sp.]